MIDPKRLTDSDVERGVVYVDGLGNREDGIIKSWNDRIIFVRYARSLRGAPTHPQDLHFTYGTYQERDEATQEVSMSHVNFSAKAAPNGNDPDLPIRITAIRLRPDEDETFDISKTAARALIARLQDALRELSSLEKK